MVQKGFQVNLELAEVIFSLLQMIFQYQFCKPSSFFVFLTYIDFAPDGLSCKKGRSNVYKLKTWAEVNV